MSINKTDFHDAFTTESEFYDDLFTVEKDKFNDWISNNFVELETIKSYEEVIPSIQLMDNFIQKGYKHRGSQCHFSAKAICLLNEEFEYLTGFITSSDMLSYRIVTHSFNMFNKKLIDFSRIDDDFIVIKDKLQSLPNTYYGIKIPSSFVKKYKAETFNNYSMRPLLFEWYIENQ